MKKRGRSCYAAFMACIILLLGSAPAYPSYNSEAGREYTVACRRLSDLRKSNKKKKYRSYWMDCVRTFELVEKEYPRSPSAADACFDRAALYFELYQFSKYSRDLDKSIASYGKCQGVYPRHAKAPEALYRSMELSLDFKKNKTAATKTYRKLAAAYPGSAWTGKARTRLGIHAPARKKAPKGRKQAQHAVAAASARQGVSSVVKNIRYWSEGDYTRIVIDENNPIEYQVQELKQPDRLVFDLQNARVDAAVKKGPLAINDGILKQVRASQYSADTVRVVLDLASIKSYVVLPLRDPSNPRLVIDVTGENAGNSGGADNPASAGTGSQAKKDETAPEMKKTPPPSPPLASAPQKSPPDNEGKRLTLSQQLGMQVKTIAIDAGHGGYDPGAIGKNGLKEKDVTLDIAKRLAVLVKERLGCRVVMTRDRDVFVPLDQRPFIAKSHNADLFISIHVNANRRRATKGIETYVQGLKASDREAMATAARENAMSARSLSELDSEVDRMLKDLKIDNKIEESIQLAGAVQNALVDTAQPKRRSLINHGVKSAFFYVLMNTNIPSILAEVGFISNPEEEKRLSKGSYRQSIAEALFDGVKKYVNARSPQLMGI